MLFEQIVTPGLAHYSYIVACPRSKQALVIDPRRDVDVYLDFAKTCGLKIAAIFETHIHADYASGAGELAAQTSAPIFLSHYDRGEKFEVSFRHHELGDGDSFVFGDIRISVLHTPGHTPEHISYLLFDRAAATDNPSIMLSGDFLFVGSLGRPDLLGNEAKAALAAKLQQSVTDKLHDLPDALEIFPAHGAGSMCGAGMSSQNYSSLASERASNAFLDPKLRKEDFIAKILSNVPPFPPYYLRMKEVNSRGARILGGQPEIRPLKSREFDAALKSGAFLLDMRTPAEFATGHVPGSLNIGAGASLSTWASWLVPYDRPLLFVLPEAKRSECATALIRVGLDEFAGYLEGGMNSWQKDGFALKTIRQMEVHDLSRRIQSPGSLRVVDVRNSSETAQGKIPDAVHIPLHQLVEHINEVKNIGGEVAVTCAGGYRSMIAASLLESAGMENVINLTGGMGAWSEAKLKTTQA